MLAAIGIHDTLGVEPLVTNDDAVIEYFNLAQTMRRGQAGDQAVSAADRGRIVDGQMKQPPDFRCWGVLMWSLSGGLRLPEITNLRRCPPRGRLRRRRLRTSSSTFEKFPAFDFPAPHALRERLADRLNFDFDVRCLLEVREHQRREPFEVSPHHRFEPFSCVFEHDLCLCVRVFGARRRRARLVSACRVLLLSSTTGGRAGRRVAPARAAVLLATRCGACRTTSAAPRRRPSPSSN